MNNNNLNVENRKVKCKIITVGQGDNPVEMLKIAMNQLKASRYRRCQFTTLFQTKNPKEQYRPCSGIELADKNPKFNMWNNEPNGNNKSYYEEGYEIFVNAPIIAYSVQYY